MHETLRKSMLFSR